MGFWQNNIFRRPLWYLFEAPQRQEGIIYTVLLELRTAPKYFAHRLQRKLTKKQKPVSLCLALRADELGLLADIPALKDLSLSVCIYGPAEQAAAEATLKKLWQNPYTLSFKPDFSKIETLNKAILQAPTELVFTYDKLYPLPKNLISLCNRHVSEHTAWFPHELDKSKNLFTKSAFCCTKEQFIRAGMLRSQSLMPDYEFQGFWIGLWKVGVVTIR